MHDNRSICGNPNCATCRNHFRFEMPEEIPRALKEGRLVLFAGAGVSTEARGVFPSTFYDEIAAEIGVDLSEDLPFPTLMSRFSKIKGRRELLIRIKKRFDYLGSFPDVHFSASRFHEAISTIPFLEEIFTTNWDELFEDVCGATPIVSSEDYAFWDLPGRRVFKLHGSVSHYGSIVATEEDYAACLNRLHAGLIGSSLKLALATKTIVFAGYSVRDSDFLQLLQFVRDEMGPLTPPMYVVTLSENDRARLESLGLSVILTDASYFAAELKKVLVEDGSMLDDSWRYDIREILTSVIEANAETAKRFNCVKYPSLLYTLCCQDGLRHGLQLLLARSRKGEYSHPCYVGDKLRAYEKAKREKRAKRKYIDVAYIEGYENALMLPLLESEERFLVPLFYLFGAKEDVFTLEDLTLALPTSERLHRGAYRSAEEHVKRRGGDPEIVMYHEPWL